MSIDKSYKIYPKLALSRNKKQNDSVKGITSVEEWAALLSECSRKRAPRVAERILNSQGENFIQLLNGNDDNFTALRFATQTPTLPLKTRKSAARTLYEQADTDSLPPFLVIKRKWDHYSAPMSDTIRDLVWAAIENSMMPEAHVINRDGTFAKTNNHDSKNTVVVYIHPTHFAEMSDATSVPFTNGKRIFGTILNVLYDEGFNVLPMVQPYNNMAVQNDYRGYPMICHHTIGKQADKLHVKSAYIENYAYFDQAGYGPFTAIQTGEDLHESVNAVCSDDAEAFYRETIAPYTKSNNSSLQQGSEGIEIDRRKKYYFYAMQTVNDTVIRKAYIPQREAISTILDHFQGTNKVLVVKKHPKDSSIETVHFLIGISQHANVKIIRGNIHDLIEKTSATICINSGVGMEALMHLKPVISLGVSDYQAATHNARTKQELRALLDVDDLSHDTEYLKKFLCYFYKEHLCKVDDRAAVRKRLRYLSIFSD